MKTNDKRLRPFVTGVLRSRSGDGLMRFLLGTFLVLIAFAVRDASASDRVIVRVELASISTEGNARGDIQWFVTNTTDQPLLLLSWYLPSDTIKNDTLFRVTRDGVAVRYIGILAKRGEPLDSNYVRIEPGATLSGTCALSSAYDLSRSGSYAVQYAISPITLLHPSLHNMVAKEAPPVASNVVTFYLADASPVPQDGEDEGARKRDLSKATGAPDPSFKLCSTVRQKAILKAVKKARKYAQLATKHLNYLATDESPSFARYRRWFGRKSTSRFETIRGNFAAIRSVTDTEELEFYCGCPEDLDEQYACECDPGTFAYVFPTKHYKIHLCDAFWSAKNVGANSRAGTVIHEISHFDDVADTDDLEYGYWPARHLARRDPGRAIRNADNHEYFVEALGKKAGIATASDGGFCGALSTLSADGGCCALCGNRAAYHRVPLAACGKCDNKAAETYCDHPTQVRGELQDVLWSALLPGETDMCVPPSDLCSILCGDGAHFGRIEVSPCACAVNAELCSDHGGVESIEYGGVQDPCAVPTPTPTATPVPTPQGCAASYTCCVDTVNNCGIFEVGHAETQSGTCSSVFFSGSGIYVAGRCTNPCGESSGCCALALNSTCEAGSYAVFNGFTPFESACAQPFSYTSSPCPDVVIP